jgi:hypothetical protein
MSRVYIAGPMTGIADWNFPAFHRAASMWRNTGWDVVNPAEFFDGKTDLPYEQYVQHDLEILRSCDAIAVLDGWDGPNARGSVWERFVAEKLLRLPVYLASHPRSPLAPTSVLAEAEDLIHGARQGVYGHPLDDFSKTALHWQAILGVPVTAEQIALCMIGVKLSRLGNTPAHRDSQVDIAGYIGTYEMVVRERARRLALTTPEST